MAEPEKNKESAIQHWKPVCRVIYCEIITRPGRGWRNVVRLAETVTAGRRGRRPLQGWSRRAFVRKTQNFLAGVELLPRPAWDFAGCGVY